MTLASFVSDAREIQLFSFKVWFAWLDCLHSFCLNPGGVGAVDRGWLCTSYNTGKCTVSELIADRINDASHCAYVWGQTCRHSIIYVRRTTSERTAQGKRRKARHVMALTSLMYITCRRHETSHNHFSSSSRRHAVTCCHVRQYGGRVARYHSCKRHFSRRWKSISSTSCVHHQRHRLGGKMTT